jgi:hypothetical protein
MFILDNFYFFTQKTSSSNKYKYEEFLNLGLYVNLIPKSGQPSDQPF